MSGARFAPGQFKYNGRVAAALIPSLIVLAGFGGKIPVGVALVGAMVSYILDAMRYREGALGSVWITLGSINLSMLLSGAVFTARRPLMLSLLIAMCNGITLFTTGVWATLQFKWIQLQYPVVVLAFEKLLLATAFTVAAMVQSWGLIAAVGAAVAPFYLVPILCGLYYMLALPLTTSFHVRGAKDSAIGGKRSKELQVQEPIEGCCAAVILVVLPWTLYIVVNWGPLPHLGHHFWSMLLLIYAPVLFLSILKEGLWWLPWGPKRRNFLRQGMCHKALLGGLAGLEGRVIFPAFGQYIQLHPPWNYIAVTVALYGAGALGIAHLSGGLGDSVNVTLTGVVLMAAAALGGLAVGLPLILMAAPLLAAGGLALYLESLQLRDYAVFMFGASLSVAWFIAHHFWFLDVMLQGLHLRTLCVMLWVAILPALALPGLTASKGPQWLVSGLLLLQGVLVAFLEEHLYMGADEVGGEMYPAVMVLLTSALGMAVAQRLKSRDSLGQVTAWLLHCMYASKLAMLLLPQAKLPLPIFFLALAISAPLLLHQAPQPQAARLGRAPNPWQGLAHVAATVWATLHARYAIYEALHTCLGARPAEGTLVGALLLVAAGGCTPLLTRHYPQWREGRRWLVLVAVAGLLLTILRPPLPLQGGAQCPGWLPSSLCFRLWDKAHSPEHELDDVAIWGEYGERRERWPLWMLAGAALAAVATATSHIPGSKSAAGGLFYAALSGISIGSYLALEFFPGQLSLQLVVVVVTLAVAGVLVGLQMCGRVSPAVLGLLLAVWAGGLPLALFIQAVVPLPVLPEDARRLFADASVLVEQQRQQANRAALLAVYSAHSLLLAFALKLRVSAALSGLRPSLPEAGPRAAAIIGIGNAYADSVSSFLGQCLPTPVPVQRSTSIRGPLGGALAELSSEGLAWLPTVANLITLSCFGLSLLLNTYLTQGSDLAVFLLAPILLLLSQDPLLSALTSRRRYFPMAVAVSSYLGASSALQAFSAWAAPESLTKRATSSTVALLKNLVLMAAALQSHFHFDRYLWSQYRSSGATLLVIGPLNVFAVLFTDLAVVRLLAATGLLMLVAQYAAMQHVRTEGMKLV